MAHEMAGQKAEIQGVELYDIIQERPYSPSSASATGGKNAVVGGKIGRPLEITIREMLSGVKDADGKAYFQSDPPTDTPAFKSWFGDSKVVDDAGEPLTLWHQTGADIEAFDTRMWAQNCSAWHMETASMLSAIPT